MPIRFIPVRIPETGAHWDAPETALATHPGLERLDQEPKDQADPPRPKKTAATKAAASATKSTTESKE